MKVLNRFSALVFSAVLLLGIYGVVQAATAVSLGTADGFAVLGGSGITNTGTTTIVGDVGSYPTTTQTGFGTVSITGTNHAGDGVTQGAKTDLDTAYINAAGQTPTTTYAPIYDLGGATLTPGVYNDPSSFAITGTLTLDGGGNPNAVFIFQAGSTLTTASGSRVTLTNGTQACNVFWQVGSSATLGTGSDFKGNLLAFSSITDDGGSTIQGRLLARGGLVTLNNTSVSKATCAVPAPSGSTGSTGTINVVKLVINDNGGTDTISDFPLFINDLPVVSGATTTLSSGSTYTAHETSSDSYAQSFSGDCDADGRMVLSASDHLFCVITNDDIGEPTVVPPVPPLIEVVKVPSPLALPDGPGDVDYAYTLTNIGTVPVTDITMVDDSCDSVVLDSGDTDDDEQLDLDETWLYSCSTTLSETHTNTVVTTGWANGLSVADIATATVVVGEPTVPPLIHVTKIPDTLTLPIGGGPVTYTETITNPGTVPLNAVSITDDKCNPVTYVSGDINEDELLDPTEAWVYTCEAELTETTTNTAIAGGRGNGITVRDFAIATVVVTAYVPSLPDTGLAPSWSLLTWGAITVLAIGVVSAFFLVSKRKRIF